MHDVFPSFYSSTHSMCAHLQLECIASFKPLESRRGSSAAFVWPGAHLQRSKQNALNIQLGIHQKKVRQKFDTIRLLNMKRAEVSFKILDNK